MDEALRALLVGFAPLTALVSQRIFWDTIPQGTAKPSVVMFLVDGLPDYHTAGPSGLVESRVQIDFRAATRTAALDGYRKINAVLGGYRGIVGAVKFSSIFEVGSRSGFEDNGAESFFLRSADYQIWSGNA